MKKFTFFGRTISIKVEKKNVHKSLVVKLSSESKQVKLRIFLLVAILSIIGIIPNINYHSSDFNVGMIATKNIVSPITIDYRDNLSGNISSTADLKDYILSNKGLYTKLNTSMTGIATNKAALYFQYSSDPYMLQKKLGGGRYPINKEVTEIIDNMSSREKVINEQTIFQMIQIVFANGFFNLEDFKDEISAGGMVLSPDMNILLTEFIQPSNSFNFTSLQKTLSPQMQQIFTFNRIIYAGDVLVPEGTVITQGDLNKMQMVGLYTPRFSLSLMVGMILYYIVLGTLIYFICVRYLMKKIADKNTYYSTIIALLIMVIFSKILGGNFQYLLPFGALVLLLGILFSEQYTFVISLIGLLYLFSYNSYNIQFFIMNFVTLVIAIYYIKRIKVRTDIISAGFAISLGLAATSLAFSLIMHQAIFQSVTTMLASIVAGFFAGAITMGILPYFESGFNILTEIKMMELGDVSSSELIQEMVIKAPGTFQHVLTVSSIAYAAAKAIGANATFVRVAALYHDIGKTKRPQFFAENQLDGVNPHDKLTPMMSALIIKSHTKDGVELGKEYKIPKEIRDIMMQHQGTGVIQFFYAKALEENKNVNIEDFKHDGPIPQNREAAIIMLADCVEAAVRSLQNKNSVEIEFMVRKLINSRIHEEQLIACDITFKDLEMIIRSFVDSLKSTYHPRIAYPKGK